jgi:hypothetical protein
MRIVTLARTSGVAQNTATVTTSTPETDTANNQSHTSVPITGPFTPPTTRTACVKVTLRHSALVAGLPAELTVTARRSGELAGRVVVEARGAGVTARARTGAAGKARLTVTPSAAGVLRVTAPGSRQCGTRLEVPVPGEFRPPQLTG